MKALCSKVLLMGDHAKHTLSSCQQQTTDYHHEEDSLGTPHLMWGGSIAQEFDDHRPEKQRDLLSGSMLYQAARYPLVPDPDIWSILS